VHAVLPKVSAALGFLCLASACVVSTDAVVTDAIALLDDRFVGTWIEKEGTDTAVVSRDSSGVYVIAYKSAGGTGWFAGRLGRLGGRTVLDFSATPRKNEVTATYENYLLPVHVLLTIDIQRDSLVLAALECEPLRAALKEGRVRLPSTETQNHLVLHATSGELQAALGPYLTSGDVLSARATWLRTGQVAEAAEATAARRPAGSALQGVGNAVLVRYGKRLRLSGDQ